MFTQHLQEPHLTQLRMQGLQLRNHGRYRVFTANAVRQQVIHGSAGALGHGTASPRKTRQRIKQFKPQGLGLRRQLLTQQLLPTREDRRQQRHDGLWQMGRVAARRRVGELVIFLHGHGNHRRRRAKCILAVAAYFLALVVFDAQRRTRRPAIQLHEQRRHDLNRTDGYWTTGIGTVGHPVDKPVDPVPIHGLDQGGRRRGTFPYLVQGLP